MASDGETWCANDPNFAVIYSFLKVFGKLYGLEVPTITKLQESIEDSQEVSETLKELHLRLLRRALKSVHSNRWEKGMIKFCHQQGHHQEAWEIERFSYKKASTQVKLKVLKILLEYQFTCHPKFKTAVNAISCKELRLDPIGRDQNGCAYWLQVDDDANICLYKEDQDEETWQLIARNREELVKVIGQLKSGEEIGPSQISNANEDSSGAENHVQELHAKPELNSQKLVVEDDENEEEFLSPESESEQEETEQKDPLSDPVDGNETNVESSDPLDSNDAKAEFTNLVINEQIDEKPKLINETNNKLTETQTENTQVKNDEKNVEEEEAKTDNFIEKSEEDELLNSPECAENKTSEGIIETSKEICEKESNDTDETSKVDENLGECVSEVEAKIIETDEHEVKNSDENPDSPKPSETSKDSESILEDDNDSTIKLESKSENNLLNEEVSEAIEEPVMLVTGDGNGAECESFFIGEEISEPVMFFYGEGYGYDNDTGNPEAIEDTNQVEEENGKEEVVNGEHEVAKTKSKIGKSVRLKAVNKRTLKKQSNDTNEVKPDTKKPCVRDTDKSHSTKIENCLKREANVNDKSTTDSESPRKNNVKKSRSKVKKKVTRKLKLKRNGGKVAINSVETDSCQDKTSIIEKRKSSVSSEDQDDNPILNEKEKTPDKESKVEDPLPTKKLRLETTPESDINATHSKDVVSDSIEKDDSNHDSISKRKKMKASKGKFKRKAQIQDLDKSNDIDRVNNSTKKSNKSLKRTLITEPMSDKNKSESQSESEDDEPITIGKRLKIKPKKIITSSRKKVEAKLLEKHSSDESEEETLYSLAGKKSSKKLMKKKPKGKPKDKNKMVKTKTDKANSDDSDSAPVRQSRRIAQQKIKEEAERRHQEEVALRELKMIHKKKSTKDEEEEEWCASGRSSSEAEARPKQRRTWRASDSTGPEPDSESDSPLFDLHPEPEPEHDFGKSDHEFSPESDLEGGESSEPLKRARTLQEEKDDGFCKRCGSAEQPEWILLCDSCDAGYHASCLKPMLFVVPEGDWFCPPCNHDKLIKALESELVKYDELLAKVEEERARKKLEEPEPVPEDEKKSEAGSDASSDSSWSSSSGDAAVYRLRARRQLPVSVRGQEYDRIISAAIKEEYVEPTTSAGNQGRGKDISTIIEAAEEEKMKAEREAIEQGKPVESLKKIKKKQRRKPRKLNSLEVPSEDDDETDEDFKDIGGASSSEDISSSADKESSDSRSSDSLPIRRTGRIDKKDRPKMRESSPETKKKKKVFEDSSSESAGAKEWNNSKSKSKSHSRHRKRDKRDRRDKSKKKSRGLTQYDADGNVIRARVTYGGLSGGEGENDWSPKHRTRQKKINYTEMPNTESEDEMHKSSGKHMPDSSDEFKCSDSEFDSDSDSDRKKKRKEEENAEREKALSDLVKKTAVVPLEKLPEDVTKAKTEELQAHLNAQQASARPVRGKGSRGGRGSRGPRGRGGARCSTARASSPQTDDALAKLVGVKIKELGQDGSPVKASQLEREKKRQEREAKQAEKEAKKLERLQKKEEKEKLKEQKAKEREEKRLARIALQESKRIKKEKEYVGGMGGYGVPVRPLGAESPRVNHMAVFNHMRPVRPAGPPGPAGPTGPTGPDGAERYPNAPRLQVRAELRGVAGDHRSALTREGTLSVAGSPQPFKPVSEEPSIITRMPHMLNQQYRGPMMYGSGGGAAAGYAARPAGAGAAYGLHGLRYPHYYRMPPYSPPAAGAHHQHHQPLYSHLQGPGGPPTSMHPNQGPLHHSGGYYRAAPPGGMPPGAAGPSGSPAGSPMGTPGPHAMPGHQHHIGPHNVPGSFLPRSPGPNPSPSSGAPTPSGGLPPGAMPPRPLGAPGPPLGVPGGPSDCPQPTGQESDPPIKIKAEVKTEPEYRSPVASPGAASPGETREEPPRHPKIKVTEVRERRPRFPLGPYAPHLAPYRPYVPPLHSGPPGAPLHPGPNSHHPGSSHLGPGPHSGPSSHHPGQNHHHPGPVPHAGQGPVPHHPGPSPHHPGPGPHHPGPTSHHPRQSHPGQSPHQPPQSPHNSAPSPHHPGASVHHPGLGPHPGQGHQPSASPHHSRPVSHQLGQSSHQPGPNIHNSGQLPHRPGQSPQHPGPSPQHSGPSPLHPGPSPQHPGPNPQHLGPSPQHSGPSPQHPRPSTQHPNASPQHPGPSSQHSGPSPQHPGPSPQHPGPSPQHPGPIPQHSGPSPHHPGPGPAPHHPGQSLNHPGPPSHLRDPSQFKMERDQSPPPSGAEERPYPPSAGRGYPPAVRSPFPPGQGPYPPGGANPYPPGASGAYPPGATGPFTGVGQGYPVGARFPPNAGRGFPAGVRPFPSQFPPRTHLHSANQPAQPPQAKSPLAAPPRALSQSPHPPSHVKRGSMPFPARTVSPNNPPPYPQRAQSPRELKTRSPPVERSPPYYDRRAAAPPATREPPQESPSPSGVVRQRLESLEEAPSPGAESPPRVKVEREEGVFGGLVSYFSSQHEDDMEG